MKKINISVKGMHCVSCENIIEDGLNELESVKAKASFVNSNVEVSFDENLTDVNKIKKVIKESGYKIEDGGSTGIDSRTIFQTFATILGINYLLNYMHGINILGMIISKINDLISSVPVIDENASLMVLFVIGLMTSFHCVAMCGGINVTQCLSFKENSKYSPNLMYNLGRVTSYTIVGGIVGAIGSVFTLSVSMQAILYVVVGVFMVLMGLNLAGFDIARKILPKAPRSFAKLNKKGNGPYMVGLLNGLMPCGPLQSMQLYALSTGSFIEGATAMFFFSVGTVPLMFVFGKLGDFKNQKLAKNFMQISAILVVVLGIIMANRGLSILGFGVTTPSNTEGIVAEVNGDVQVINVDLESRSYPDIVVQKGKKVQFVINARKENINGCNNEIIIKEYGIQQKLGIGENVIEFTPDEVGTFGYSCWMGMIRATITVVE